MEMPHEAREAIARYLRDVDACLGGVSPTERAEILENLESHIYETVRERVRDTPTVHDVDAVIAELTPPAGYADAGAHPAPAAWSGRRRLCREAVWGAVWLLSGIVLTAAWWWFAASPAQLGPADDFAPPPVSIQETISPVPYPISDAPLPQPLAESPAQPRPADDIAPPAVSIQETISTVPSPVPDAPPAQPLWETILLVCILAPALSAPIGATTLGIIAIVKIRRSAGRLYGMLLAVIDSAFYPLLFANAIILYVIDDVMRATWPAFAARYGYPIIVLAAALLLVADSLIVRRLWRAVSGRPDRAPAAETV